MSTSRSRTGVWTMSSRANSGRVPVAGATLAAFLSSVAALPYHSQLIVLIGLPLAVVWFLRTTINHARSLEDAFRRIEEIERRVNAIVGTAVLGFQSSHPSRGRFVGGRTGNETIGSVLVAAATMMMGCAYLFIVLMRQEPVAVGCFLGYAAAVLCGMGAITWRLGRYRYQASRHVEILVDD